MNLEESNLHFNFEEYVKKTFDITLSAPTFKGNYYHNIAWFTLHAAQVVCTHWLRGLCKTGDKCRFLHEYDVTRMPICQFFKAGILCVQYSIGCL